MSARFSTKITANLPEDVINRFCNLTVQMGAEAAWTRAVLKLPDSEKACVNTVNEDGCVLIRRWIFIRDVFLWWDILSSILGTVSPSHPLQIIQWTQHNGRMSNSTDTVCFCTPGEFKGKCHTPINWTLTCDTNCLEWHQNQNTI